MSKKKTKLEMTEDIEMAEEIESSEEAIEEIADEADVEQEMLKLKKDRDEWKDKYLRAIAEFENYRRRTNEEKSDWITRSTEKLALSVCDVLDNFERAFAKLEPEHHADNLIKGFLMIEQQLRSVLEREGITKIEALGQDFDPQYHEALAHIPSEQYEENKVAAVIQN